MIISHNPEKLAQYGTIKSYYHLNLPLKMAIEQLAAISAKVDGRKQKIHWHLLKDPLYRELQMLGYVKDDQLIGFLFFHSFNKTVEVSVLVHPDYRHLPIIQELVLASYRHLSTWAKYLMFVVPENCDWILDYIDKKEGEKCGKEYHYLRNDHSPEVIDNKDNWRLRLASELDISLMAEFDQLCFKTLKEAMMIRYNQTIHAHDRLVWILEVDGKAIGKSHVRIDEPHEGFLHDVCIVPDQQGKGWGKVLVKATINKCLERKINSLYLDVDWLNFKVCKLYEKCHFISQGSYYYYSIPNIYEILDNEQPYDDNK